MTDRAERLILLAVQLTRLVYPVLDAFFGCYEMDWLTNPRLVQDIAVPNFYSV